MGQAAARLFADGQLGFALDESFDSSIATGTCRWRRMRELRSSRSRAWWIALLSVMVATSACSSSGGGQEYETLTSAARDLSTSTSLERTALPTLPASFASGTYYAAPVSGDRSGLRILGGQLTAEVQLGGVGFDVRRDLVVFVEGTDIITVTADGSRRTRPVRGLHHMARPSFSPDGTRVAVQASESAAVPPSDLNIYVIELATGIPTRISSRSVNEESPKWVNDERVAYASFSASDGIRTHVHDVARDREVSTIGDGFIHFAVSHDGRSLFVPSSGKIYDVDSGAIVADIGDALLRGLRSLGFEPDDRYRGQAGLGTFPLAASFAADGASLVFDGAVRKDGRYGVALFSAGVDGSETKALTPMIDVDPARSNNHNYSQLTPTTLTA